MRAALNGDFAATTSGHQRRQDGLENKRRASGGPHGKAITSGPHRSRSEGECLRTERSAFNLSAPHLTGSKNRSQMLAKKSETSPAWRGCSPCGRFSGQHLSAAFACRSVNPDRAALSKRVSQDPAYPFTHTT
jgi:hypothetical protein